MKPCRLRGTALEYGSGINDVSRNRRKNKWRYRRGRIYRKCNGRCHYCGCLLNYEDCTLDHVIPRTLGGETTDDNLVISCYECNQLKGDRDAHDPVVRSIKKRHLRT
jgi:5-methylcytosine-specific restriction endonuclease McrA